MKPVRFSSEKLSQLIDRWPDYETFANLLGALMPKDLARPSKQSVEQWKNGTIPSPKYLWYLKLVAGYKSIDDFYEEYEVEGKAVN